MKTKYSDSLVPLGIGSSFISLLLFMLFTGTIAGLCCESTRSFKQLGGIPLLLVFLTLLVGPLFYNKKTSRFEKAQKTVTSFKFFGEIQGLRGTFIKLLVYEESIEIRAFYHRYYLPFTNINSISTDPVLWGTKLNIASEIDGTPNYIISSEEQFSDIAALIETKFKSNKKSDYPGYV